MPGVLLRTPGGQREVQRLMMHFPFSKGKYRAAVHFCAGNGLGSQGKEWNGLVEIRR